MPLHRSPKVAVTVRAKILIRVTGHHTIAEQFAFKSPLNSDQAIHAGIEGARLVRYSLPTIPRFRAWSVIRPTDRTNEGRGVHDNAV
jgi:hypothetical protein